MTVRDYLKKIQMTGISKDLMISVKVLLCDILNIDRNVLFKHYDDELSSSRLDRLEKDTNRLLSGEPLAYITGKAPFGDLMLYVDNNVLIPRQDTEITAETASQKCINISNIKGKISFLDLCCGSGCIFLFIRDLLDKKEIDYESYASDISEKALNVARINQENCKPLCRTDIRQGDLFEPWNDLKFDVVVSNPPYIPTKKIDLLDINVRDHEPRLALDGGASGMDIYKRIIEEAPMHIIHGGYLVLEAGFCEADEIAELMKTASFSEIEIIKDYNNIDRVVSGKNE